MSCYFASIEKMKNDYPINNILNKKDNCLFHICMLKPKKDHMNPLHVQMMDQQDLIELFQLL